MQETVTGPHGSAGVFVGPFCTDESGGQRSIQLSYGRMRCEAAVAWEMQFAGRSLGNRFFAGGAFCQSLSLIR